MREAQASREPVWAHESLLPLWLVKTYEERVSESARVAGGMAGCRCLALSMPKVGILQG